MVWLSPFHRCCREGMPDTEKVGSCAAIDDSEAAGRKPRAVSADRGRACCARRRSHEVATMSQRSGASTEACAPCGRACERCVLAVV